MHSFRCLKIRKSSLLLPALALFAQATLADGVVVVDSNQSGYFYMPSKEQLENRTEEISLQLIKEGGFTEYRIESDPPGLSCDERCAETVQRLPVGTVQLKIIGDKPFPLLKIPLRGQWQEGCDNGLEESGQCLLKLHANNSKVRVLVSPSVETGTVLTLPGGSDEVMFIQADSSRGHAVLAAHTRISGALTWLDFDPRDPLKHKDINIKSWNGADNSQKLLRLNSRAASYCEKLNEKMPGARWHLPSKPELAPLTRDVLKKLPGFNDRLWSSTQASFREDKGGGNGRKSSKNGYYRLATNALSSNGDWDNDRYVYECDRLDLSCKNVRQHQVLCVTHQPI